ncbi:hypothetical protein [Paenibacillus agricola]|uniref:LPXTG-motif cell wall-anchored protein n=1 Tax=Paenibacillus agricola TaxID=2716264 RepID=A0ABX0IWX9_9BACL|nr:hypothetical protein [Paenibacillus agricola]NHN28432.1 hypothetical protein [Paenibacillus agricola]
MSLSTTMIVTLCIFTIFLIAGLIGLILRTRKKNRNRFAAGSKSRSRKPKRVPIAESESPPKSLSKQLQSCSYCKRKVKPKELTFYSGPSQVIGVCRSCRPQAERQELLKL